MEVITAEMVNYMDWPAQNIKKDLKCLFSFVLVFWIVHAINSWVFQGSLSQHGVVPRSVKGLWGVIFAPFLHGGWWHLISNTIPFLVLGSVVLVRGMVTFLEVTLMIALVAGSGVWIIGAGNSVHVGASSLVFGYFGMIISAAWFEKKIVSMLTAVLTLMFYGGMFFGLLPLWPGVSWEGHLFGFLGGVLSARLIKLDSDAET